MVNHQIKYEKNIPISSRKTVWIKFKTGVFLNTERVFLPETFSMK